MGDPHYKGLYQDKYLASTEFGKQASGTIDDYLTGTITLVFGIFFLFLLLSVFTIVLTTFARYKGRAKAPSSFTNPPPRAYRPHLQVTAQPQFRPSPRRSSRPVDEGLWRECVRKYEVI